MIVTSDRFLVLCTVIFSLGDVFAQRVRFQKYRWDPWTGRTSSVEEFDDDIRNMDARQLSKYMNELTKVRNGLEDMRRESEILERELGFGLGGFPSLMDNSENIIRHALDSVTNQMHRRLGHIDPKLVENQQKFEEKIQHADRPTLQKNLERLQQTKQELTNAKERARSLKNDLGYDFEDVPGAMERAENAIDHGMQVINHRLQKLDNPQLSHSQANQENLTNTMKKVDDAVRTADRQRLSQFGNEFQKMRQYMDNVRATLNNFHKDIGFELDGVFEPFKMAQSILDHGLQTINNQLHAPGAGQVGGPQQGYFPQQNQAGQPQQGPYQQQYPAGGPQQGPYQQQYPAGGPQQGPYQQQYPAGGQQQGPYPQQAQAGGPQQGPYPQQAQAGGPQQGPNPQQNPAGGAQQGPPNQPHTCDTKNKASCNQTAPAGSG